MIFIICAVIIIVGVICLLKMYKDESQDVWYSATKIKPKETASVKKEPDKFWNDLSKYSENLTQFLIDITVFFIYI